jgi:hypothetical protein
MRIATMMSIAVLGFSGAAIAQVATLPDQDVPTMQNEIGNNMAAPDDTIGNDVMTNDTVDDTDATLPPILPDTAPSTLPPTVPDTVDSTTPPTPDGTTTTPDDTGATS